jgi:hypothetical protein
MENSHKNHRLEPVAQLEPNFGGMVLVKLSSAVQPSWSEGGTTRHNFGRGPSNDYFIKGWFQLSNWFQTRRFLSPSKIVFGISDLRPRWPPQPNLI